MFTGISTYLLMTLLIWWAFCGYIWLLFLFQVLKSKECRTCQLEVRPKIAVLIACYNEVGLALRKVQNTRELSYPPEALSIYFLNGLSSDGTADVLSQAIAGQANWHLVETGVAGKIHQLNVGLAMLPADVKIVVNTDMDAFLESGVLEKFAQAFSEDDRIAVVGANISPGDCLDIEKNYWEGQNTLRILESAVYSSSIVVAPCYAFRRSVLSAFPDDCVADDIYVAFKANTLGLRTRYIVEAKGFELRCPNTAEQFLSHKFRKGNAFLQELLRILYMLPRMNPWWKVIYLTKLLQVAVIPWVLPYFALATLSFLLSGGALFQLAILCCGALVASMIASSVSLNRFKSVHFNGSRQGGQGILVPFIIANLVMVLVGLTYPLYRQDSKYQKVGDK